MARPVIEPVTDLTLPEFARFLHENLQSGRSPAEWLHGLQNQWVSQQPNYGFVVRDAGVIVGGIGAYYADRLIKGRVERFCNITSWCVLDAFRQQSMRLAMAVVSQGDWHFTDFSPTKVVGATLRFFKFKELDERVAVILNLPGFSFSGKNVLHRRDEIEGALTADQLKIYRDHAVYPWLNHVLVGGSGNWCHVIYKKRTFKGMPAAAVLYLSDPTIFCECFGILGAHFLSRAMVSTHVECRFLDTVPKPFAVRTGFNPKLYLSATLSDGDIDYLYSETVALDL
jgi:hypothetical protein